MLDLVSCLIKILSKLVLPYDVFIRRVFGASGNDLSCASGVGVGVGSLYFEVLLGGMLFNNVRLLIAVDDCAVREYCILCVFVTVFVFDFIHYYCSTPVFAT